MGRRAPCRVLVQVPASEDSRAARTVGPSYHGELVEGSTTLSPKRADTGMIFTSSKLSSRERVSISSTTLSKALRDQLTPSTLLTQTITECTPSRAAMQR